MNTNNSNNYDAFLSYSSKDKEYALRIQKFIESYRPPNKVSNLKIRFKIFRDKDDQGLSHDYRKSFHSWIDNIPGFILVGSQNALSSGPVIDEINKFVEKGSDNLYLTWIDCKSEPNFPEVVRKKYPNAIYADFRQLQKTNFIKWIIKDRKAFKVEALRIVALLLSQKLNENISLDYLLRRDKQRSTYRKIVAIISLVLLTTVFAFYVQSTPKNAWQLTPLLSKQVSNYQFKNINGKLKLWIISEISKPWEDSESGESGYDSDVTIYQLNEDGTIEGYLSYSTCQIERDLCSDPIPNGSFKELNKDEIINITKNAFTTEGDRVIDYQIDEDMFSKISYQISPYNNGTIYMSSVKDTYPFEPKNGGIYRSFDFGKKWEPLKMDMWNSFSDIVFDMKTANSFTVILSEITGTNTTFPLDNPELLPSIWTTNNNGSSWHQINLNGQNIDLKNLDLIWMTSNGNLFGIIPRNNNSNQLIIFKNRKLKDRLLQRFDDF